MLVKHIIKITKQKAFYHTDRQRASSVVCGQIGLWARNQWGMVLQLSPPENSKSQQKREDKKGEECREEKKKICVERWNRRSGQERDELIRKERV